MYKTKKTIVLPFVLTKEQCQNDVTHPNCVIFMGKPYDTGAIKVAQGMNSKEFLGINIIPFDTNEIEIEKSLFVPVHNCSVLKYASQNCVRLPCYLEHPASEPRFKAANMAQFNSAVEKGYYYIDGEVKANDYTYILDNDLIGVPVEYDTKKKNGVTTYDIVREHVRQPLMTMNKKVNEEKQLWLEQSKALFSLIINSTSLSDFEQKFQEETWEYVIDEEAEDVPIADALVQATMDFDDDSPTDMTDFETMSVCHGYIPVCNKIPFPNSNIM